MTTHVIEKLNIIIVLVVNSKHPPCKERIRAGPLAVRKWCVCMGSLDEVLQPSSKCETGFQSPDQC